MSAVDLRPIPPAPIAGANRDAAPNFMRLALSMAKRGLGQTWPNPSVGAVIADAAHTRILGVGATGWGGRPHAETLALAAAGEAARGAALYVTLEPCAHHGMTPPCADALIAAGISRVYYGIVDPDRRVAGQGLVRLAQHGVAVSQGPFAHEARWLTLGHILRVTERRPFIQMKLAVGSDGLIPSGDGAPVWVTCEEARAYAHVLRAETDAIAVGSGTLKADDPQLTCRLPGLERRSPVRVIFARLEHIPLNARLFHDIESVPVWAIAGEAAAESPAARALTRAGATVLTAPAAPDGRICVRGAAERLAENGVTRLFVEGGPALAGAFLEAGLVDEILLFHAARAAGPGGIAPFSPAGLQKLTEFQLVEVKPVACDTVRVYRRKDHLARGL